MLCRITRTRYVVVSAARNLHGSGAVLLLLPHSSSWNDSEQATCELPLLSLFVRGHRISIVLESFADWTIFHAAERRQCELPLLPARGAEAMRVATLVRCHSCSITPRSTSLKQGICPPPACAYAFSYATPQVLSPPVTGATAVWSIAGTSRLRCLMHFLLA